MRVMKLKLFPSCTQRPRASSFWIEMTTFKEDAIFKTISSVYIEPEGEPVQTPESWFTNSSESASSTTEFDESSTEFNLQEIIREAQKSADQRLFFEPGSDTNSIVPGQYRKLYTAKNADNKYIPQSAVCSLISSKRRKKQRSKQKALLFPSPPPKLAYASVMMSLESEDPYKDFKRSMEEMV